MFKVVLAFFVCQSFYLEATKSSKKSSKTSAAYKNLDEDVKKLRANNIKCKQSNNFEAIMRLKCEGKFDEALMCIGGKLLNENPMDGELWTVLGQVYNKRGEVSRGNKCFKEASKISGKLVSHISQWDFLGPFQIGKPEVDGDPVETLGGILKVSCRRHDKNYVAYSELVNGGEIRWSKIVPKENGVVSVSPKIDWNMMVNGLHSMAVTEWQGWLLGDFYVNNEMTIFIQCLGVHTIYINENILPGDVYSREHYWYPLHIKPGIHSILLKARAKVNLMFSCNIRSSDSSPSFQIHKPLTPDVVDGYIFSDTISVPVTNYSPTKWLKIAKVSIMSQNSGPNISLVIDKSQKSLPIAPGQLRAVTLYFKYKDDQQKPTRNVDISGVLRLGSSDGKYGDISFLIRCRKRTESFQFTFIDHDGSVQHAATIFPIVKNEMSSTQIYPVLLTLHGTGVPAQNQADSYKRMEKGNWVFGVEGLWTLAPTRHGAHNWEGPGELTSMTALRRLAELTMKNDWVNCKANKDAVVFAGHSMGGHGTWQLSTHHPDIALAVISIAGWIKKEDYGDSNVFFQHDISVSHTDPSTKQVMEACVSENDADKHVSNLKGVPVMIRVGAKDSTVLPYFSRRMYRLIKEQGNDVTYFEIPNKEHWWWDTYNTNDGGVVNDPEVRNFAIKSSKHAERQLSSAACSKNQDDESCVEETTTRYLPDEKQNRNHASSGQFTLTVYNPAGTNGVRGVRILQQASPFRKSVIEINISETNVTLITTNVVRLRLTKAAISPVHWHKKLVVIDDVQFPVDSRRGGEMDVCLENFENWKECGNANETFESEFQRGPANLGPARRVAESPLLIVVATSNDDETNQVFRQLAVYIANLFYLTSDAFVPVLRDKDVANGNLRDRNLIVLGETNENSFVFPYVEKSPLNFQKHDSIKLGRCVFRSSNMGALFLVPHSGSRLALIITGTSLLGIRDVVHLASPTIPPMTRSPFSNLVPDYVITGPEFRARGPGGYLCAGFWGNQWEYKNDLSSCAC